MSNENYLNPFDNDQHQFFVLANQQAQYSLWPDFAAQPAGWEVRFGPSDRNQCLEYIEQHWPEINPFRPAE